MLLTSKRSGGAVEYRLVVFSLKSPRLPRASVMLRRDEKDFSCGDSPGLNSIFPWSPATLTLKVTGQ